MDKKTIKENKEDIVGLKKFQTEKVNLMFDLSF